MVKVFKTLGNRHGRRGEDSRVDLGQPLGCQGLANVDALRGHRLSTGAQPAIDLQRVDIVLVGAVNDEFEVLGKLVQATRDITQVDNDLGLVGGNGLHQRVDTLVRLLQRVDGGMGRLQEIMPIVRLAQLGANPQIRIVVTPTGTAAKLANAIKHIGNRHARTRNRRRRFGSEAQVERGALRGCQIAGNLAQCTGTRTTQALKQNARFVRRHHARPLTACLALDGVGLVDHPVTDRRQNSTLGRNVAEQQGVIGDHHVGMRCATAGAVDQALIGEKGAEAARTLARRRRKVGTVDAAPANAKRVEVAVGRLAHVRHDDRDCRKRVGRIALGGNFDLAAAHTLELAQARIVVISLQRAKREATVQLLGKFWQLMIHELVGKIIRFSRDTNRNVVAARGLGERHQIGHRLTDARARLDDAMRARNEGIANLERHRDLLIARLIRGIHAIDQAARGVVRLDFLATRHLENRQLVRINTIVRAVGLEYVGASGTEGEDGAGVLSRQEREDGTIGPGHVGVHVGQARHKALWQVGERHEQHAPHATQGVDIGVGAVRHRVAAKQVGHERQLMRGQAWKCDSRKRQRIDPDVADVDTALDRLDKRTVEGGVMRDHGAAADKIGKRGHGLDGRRGICHIGVCNAREFGNLGGNQLLGMHERIKAVNDLAARKAGRGNLN